MPVTAWGRATLNGRADRRRRSGQTDHHGKMPGSTPHLAWAPQCAPSTLLVPIDDDTLWYASSESRDATW